MPKVKSSRRRYTIYHQINSKFKVDTSATFRKVCTIMTDSYEKAFQLTQNDFNDEYAALGVRSTSVGDVIVGGSTKMVGETGFHYMNPEDLRVSEIIPDVTPETNTAARLLKARNYIEDHFHNVVTFIEFEDGGGCTFNYQLFGKEDRLFIRLEEDVFFTDEQEEDNSIDINESKDQLS